MNIPAISFASIVMCVGIIGNIHALLVYGFFYRAGNHRQFVLWLSTFDLLACCITIPLYIVYHVNYYTFQTDINCKMITYFSTFFAGFSLALLDIIAVDRYRRISNPLKKQLSRRTAKIVCIVTSLVMAILSIPNIVLSTSDKNVTFVNHSSNSFRELQNANITGRGCYTLYEEVNVVYTLVEGVIVLSLFILCIVLYILVMWHLLRQDKPHTVKSSLTVCVGCIRSHKNKDNKMIYAGATGAKEIRDGSTITYTSNITEKGSHKDRDAAIQLQAKR